MKCYLPTQTIIMNPNKNFYNAFNALSSAQTKFAMILEVFTNPEFYPNLDLVWSDAEYWNPFVGPDGNMTPRPGPHTPKACLMIGAIRLTKRDGKITYSSFSQFVDPKYIEDLGLVQAPVDGKPGDWEMFTKITKITREQIVADCKPFDQVWNDFTNFVDGATVIVILGDENMYKHSHHIFKGKVPKLEKDQHPDSVSEMEGMDFIVFKHILPGEVNQEIQDQYPDFSHVFYWFDGKVKQPHNKPVSGLLWNFVPNSTTKDVCKFAGPKLEETGDTHNGLFDAASMVWYTLYMSTLSKFSWSLLWTKQ